jgi:hypothetical protein
VTYTELVNAIQGYTENQFPVVYLADGTQQSITIQINRFIEQTEQRVYNTIQFPSLRANVTGALTSGNSYLSCPVDFLSVYSLAVYPTTGANAGQYTYLINKDVNFIREAYPNISSLYYSQPQYYAIFGPQYGNIAELSFMLGPTPDQTYAAELHYYYYPPTIIQGGISGLTITTAGTSYTNGTYYDVPLTYNATQPTNSGGSINGNSATATIVVSGGAVTSVTVTAGGAFYTVGDVLTVSTSYIGTSGSGFTATVSSVGNSTGITWLGDNYDNVLLYGALVEAYTFMKGEQDIIALYDAKYKEAVGQAKRLGDALERQDAYRSGQYRQPVT